MWAGQSANLSTCTDVSAFLTSLVEEVSEIAGPIIQWSAKRSEKRSRAMARRNRKLGHGSHRSARYGRFRKKSVWLE